MILHSGSNYDYHFIIRELVDVSVGKFECLGENTETYMNALVTMKKIKMKILKH